MAQWCCDVVADKVEGRRRRFSVSFFLSVSVAFIVQQSATLHFRRGRTCQQRHSRREEEKSFGRATPITFVINTWRVVFPSCVTRVNSVEKDRCNTGMKRSRIGACIRQQRFIVHALSQSRETSITAWISYRWCFDNAF